MNQKLTAFFYSVFALTFILRSNKSKASFTMETKTICCLNLKNMLWRRWMSKVNDYFFERLMMEKIEYMENDRVWENHVFWCHRHATVQFRLCLQGPKCIIKVKYGISRNRRSCNGGAFLLEPSMQDYKWLHVLIKQWFNKSFDETEGRGREIEANETWFNYNGIKNETSETFQLHMLIQGDFGIGCDMRKEPLAYLLVWKKSVLKYLLDRFFLRIKRPKWVLRFIWLWESSMRRGLSSNLQYSSEKEKIVVYTSGRIRRSSTAMQY